MTHTQRAEKMVQTMLMGTGNCKSYFEYFLSQIEEAAQEARAEALACPGQEIRASYASGFKDGFSAGAREMQKECAEAIEKPENRTVGLADGVQQEYAKIVRALPLPSAFPTLTDSPSTAKGEK